VYTIMIHAFTNTNQNKTTYFKLAVTEDSTRYFKANDYDDAHCREVLEVPTLAEATAIKVKYLKSVIKYSATKWGNHKNVFVVDAPRPPKLSDVRISQSDLEKYSNTWVAVYTDGDKYAVKYQKKAPKPVSPWGKKLWARQLVDEEARAFYLFITQELCVTLAKSPLGKFYKADEDITDFEQAWACFEDFLAAESTGETKDRDGISEEYGEEYAEFL